MSDPSAPNAQYQRARTEFGKLDPQDKAAFVVETAFAALGEAIARVGRQASDAVDAIIEDLSRAREPEAPPPPPRPQAPPPPVV